MLYFYHVKVRLKNKTHLFKCVPEFEFYGTLDLAYEIKMEVQFNNVLSKIKKSCLSEVRKNVLSQAKEQPDWGEYPELKEDLLKISLEDIDVTLTSLNRL